MNKINIACPNCKKNNTWTKNNPFKPFCSERCKLIDLGDWASEKYHLPAEQDLNIDDQDPEEDQESEK